MQKERYCKIICLQVNEELFLEMTEESSAELEKLERQLIEEESVQELRENEI